MFCLIAQLNPKIGDLKGNTKKIIDALAHARAKKTDLVLFPELTISGYPPEDLLLYDDFIIAQMKCLEEILPHTKGVMAFVGVVRKNLSFGEKTLLNSAAIIADGKLLGFYDKWLLPTYDVFDERRYFEPGNSVKVWEWKGKKVGVLICEDMWQHAGFVSETHYAKDPVMEYVPLKPDLIVNLSASPFHFQKPQTRIKVCRKVVKTLQCPMLLCCEVGGNDELIFDGYSLFLDAQGDLRAHAKGFTEDLLLVDLDHLPPFSTMEEHPIADLYSALVLGIKDYFNKLGFKKACLGISGGIDSALTACLAVDALGKENVLGISMPSRFSSPSSKEDAELLAKHLGIELLTISIEQPFTDFLKMLAPFFKGMKEDTTEENLQARIRGMILMGMSNKKGYLLLSTGNKSEQAMGYCTLYGDMAGGLSVIGDVDKTLVYELARFINKKQEIIPHSTLTKAPSAELRAGQKDSDTLPPFDILDAVIRDYVENHLSPEEIVEKNKLPKEQVHDLIKRIHKAEYKRRQAPPCIRVSKKAFRRGRRFPIVQGWA